MRIAVAALLLCFGLSAAPVTAEAEEPTNKYCLTDCETDRATVVAQAHDFGLHQHRKPSDQVPGRGKLSDGKAPGKTVWTHTEEYITPMCWANGLHGGDAMCMAAATYCQDGRIAFWVWHQVTTFTRQPDGTETSVVGSWTEEDGVFCLGADDPGVPTIGKVMNWVQDSFSTIGIAPAAITAAPAPRTLVNIETRLSAGDGAVVDIPVATPWSQVVIHAKPLRYRWHFGDGTPDQITTVPDVTHIYRHAAVLNNVHVDVEWGGTFTVAGDATAYPIVGTAQVPGTNVTVDVREARSQLVSH